jgi:DNA polymerase-3 subunit epsilon/ATP-dependent DNA helicase DinG
MPAIVALDLETTGLDANADAIIEIGAVRFNHSRIEEEFQTLLYPRRGIPEFITRLTGIDNHMVQGAPLWEDVVPDLVDFVADLPILGHNVNFDVGFMRARGLFTANPTLDTYDMASVLLPNAGRYNLGALAQIMHIELPATHRALDDARVTHELYMRLRERALNLPLDMLAEIVRLSEGIPWGADHVFREALGQRGKEVAAGHTHSGSAAGHKRGAFHGPLYDEPPPKEAQPLEVLDEPLPPMDVPAVVAMLEDGGEFSRYFPHFEHRDAQIQLAYHIAEAFSENHHLLAETGTGTGKSLAYLVPAAAWAMQNNTRVVVSTNTINLQDQLVYKDLPDLNAVLGGGLRYQVLKGRNNYLCPRRLEALRRKGPESEEELRVLAKMIIWLGETERGDLSEVNITGPAERAVWSRISANDEGCTGETCVRRMAGICPFHRARQAAQAAHILVVNHALLLADVATGNRVLPDYKFLVIDEAHHIEAATTSALSFRVTQPEVERTLRELGGTNAGHLGRMLVLAADILDPGQLASLNQLVQNATDKAFHFQNQVKNFFISISNFLEEQREGRKLGNYSQQVRVLPASRMVPTWLDVEVAWEAAQDVLMPLNAMLGMAGTALSEMSESGLEEIEDLHTNISNVYRRLSEMERNINGLVFDPSEDLIYWVEINPRYQRIVLEAAPLHIGHLMEEHIWHKKDAAILTSATMTANGQFEYIRNRLSAWDADEIALGSPYDYQSSTMLYIPDNIPEPADRNGHQAAIERGLVNLAKATGGRMLALFTSYAQLQQTSRRINAPLADAGIVVFEQGEGASPHALLESFKEAPQAVLLGTRAFWEGVDVPGEDLSVLAIIKLPFSVPSDPIVAARSETFESPFFEYQIPEAILAFRQGFGRLIRTASDHGVVAIFDRRVLTKQYGQMFIDSLPQCTVQIGPVEDLPKAAADWLGS